MKRALNLCLLVLCVLLASPSVFAGICKENIQVSNPWSVLSSNRWEQSCESVTRTDTSDPYNPKPAMAKYFTFILDRDADIRVQLDPSYSDYYGRVELIEGASEYGNILSSHQSGSFEIRLSAGTYTIEVSHIYGANFTYQIAFNDTAINNQCVQAISSGSQISDGWVSACESTNRDIVDPYNTIPGEGHRSKYFTFSLQDHTDIRIDVDSIVDTYIYILSGTGEFAIPYEEFNSDMVTTSLPQGEYTIEVTTFQRYAPGQFVIELNTYSNAGGCSQDLTLGSTVSGSWSADCEIRSWLDENGDPYQGQGPERANYYRFTLTEAKELRFRLFGQNDSNTIFSLYAAGNYLDKLATTQSSYWGNPSSEFSIRLEPGSYELEVTKYNEVAIGNYTISSFVFENDGCSNSIELGVTEEAYLASGCESLFRVVDGGMDDPYGAQPGTYYAKRFEFTLDSPSTVFMSANTNSQSGYLYLAKRIDGQWQRLTETWPENYWNTTSSPSLLRTLDAGTYVMEVTSYYPEKEGPITASIRTSSSVVCETYLTLNTRTSGLLSSNGNCRSEFKSSEYNYDPYGPNNGYQHYYAKSYTFEIEQSGTYNIVGTSLAFATNIYLMQGGDVKGQLIKEQSSAGENTISQHFEPGLYTIEVTSTTAGNTGSYSILVWDGSSEIEGGIDTNECIQTISSEETSFSSIGAWTPSCESESRSGKYAKYYDFTVPENTSANINIDLTSTVDTYLYILRQDNSNWVLVEADDDGGAGRNSKITRPLLSGNYRIEATTYSSSVQAEFQLSFDIAYLDSDGDGTFDHLDAFPNDPSEWLDTDSDGTGDNSDVFPENATEQLDTDGDGIGNNSDIDDDNDGILDYLDALPLDNTAHLDSDFDGISDELDEFPYPYAGDIRFVIQHLQVMENEDKAIITIERVGEPFLDATIFYYTEDDSAVANKDYEPSSGKLEFGAYVDSHTLEVELINNNHYSGSRSFFIKLAFPSTFVSNSQGIVAKVTIGEDDTQPSAGIISFSTSALSVNEADSTAQVEIIRSEGALGEAIVAVSTLDNTASASSDYGVLSEILIFSEGEVSKTISIPVINNEIFENKETLSVELASLTATATVIDKTMQITILDDDALPEAGEVSLIIDKMEISERTSEVVFALQRSPNSIGEVQIDWRESGLSAGGIKMLSGAGSITFAEGETYKSVTLNLLKTSNQFEGLSNKICLDLSSNSPEVHLSDKQFCLMLQETDLPPTSGFITFSGPSYRVVEGNTTTVTLNRLFSTAVTMDMPIHVRTESAQATRDVDFFNYDQEVNLLANESSTSIMIESINDNILEGEERYLVSIEHKGVIQTVPVYIIDDESEFSESGLFRFSGTQYQVNEDAGTVSIVVQRALGFAGEVSLELHMENGTAKSSDDYDGDNKLLTFADGEKSKTVEIDIHHDSVSYKEKTFSISLYSAVNNLFLTPSKALITINNIDELPESKAEVEKDSETEGENKGALGLGGFSPWWMLIMLIPVCLIRIRKVEV